jgi:YfiH family protein
LPRFQTRYFEGHAMQVHENARIMFGFSEINFPAAALQRFFGPRPLLFLRQVHADRIVREPEWRPVSEGDGLLLEKPGVVAVIQTADCLPLFFFADDYAAGGVIHVGWRGLRQGIEKKLLALLPGDIGKYSFFLGPAIEKKCYPVGEDVYRLFMEKPYAEDILTPQPDGKFLLDIRAGLTMSLRQSGIGVERIEDCNLCTYCLPERFPSFRRDGKTGKRIFNFLVLR